MKLFLYLIIFLISCSNTSKEPIEAAGATFPVSIYMRWAYDYTKDTDIKLNYKPIGSSGGINMISKRNVDFGASDAPLKTDQIEKSNLLQFPAIIGGVVPIINFPEANMGQFKLTGILLSKIFKKEILFWNHPDILKENPNINLPNEQIKTLHRSDGSGTTAIFTSYLSKVDSSFESKIGVGKKVKWIEGLSAKGNEGVAKLVNQIPYSISYVEYSYAKSKNLNIINLKNKDGYYVFPKIETFRSAAKYAKWNERDHFYLWLVNSPGRLSWPITGASFILLAKENKEKNKRVISFFKWCFENGDQLAIDKTYIPLPKSLKDKILKYWDLNI